MRQNVRNRKKIAEAFDMLPDSQQQLAYEVLRTMILHWDPDFTKLTPLEQKRLDESEADNETFSLEGVKKGLGIE